jgi:hypothetical protein
MQAGGAGRMPGFGLARGVNPLQGPVVTV